MNKKDILDKIKSLDSLSLEEKSYLINLVNTKKKYGLVWEDKPEQVEEELRTKLPILKEVKERAIVNDTESEQHPNHILIEGDNLHALTALTFTHENKIDLIYIDPPYNTGNKDFIYNDHYVDKEDSYRHSKWLTFLHKRLSIARLLLSESGFIFISIDDNEVAQLKMLCDEIFGESNFIGLPVRRRRDSQANLSKNISTIHEYVLIYRNSNTGELNKINPQINTENYKNPDGDIRGPYVTMPCTNKGGAKYSINTPTGNIHTDEWRFKKETYDELLSDNRLVFPRGGHGKPRYKLFLKDKQTKGVIANSWWDDLPSNQQGTIELKNIFNGELPFNNPKPVGLIERIIELSTNNKSTILDFFAGSGSTLDSTVNYNSKNQAQIDCILITNNENNIAQAVTYKRSKRVIKGYTNLKGEKIKGLNKNNLRYYQCDFVERTPNQKNKRHLTQLATELLCIKEDCYHTVKHELAFTQKEAQIFTNGKGKYLVAIYHSRNQLAVQEQLIAWINNVEDATEKIRVYGFSPEKETLVEEFIEVEDKIEAVPLPEAIYNAYLATIKTLKVDKKDYELNQVVEAETENN